MEICQRLYRHKRYGAYMYSGKRSAFCGPDEIDAEMAIKDGWNMVIANIHTGDVESSNALCQEICRRFNEFPQEGKL